MKTLQKHFKNHSTTIFKHSYLRFIVVLFFLFPSCKKNNPDINSINWDIKKMEIANKVKTDIGNLKKILPSTISKSIDGDISFNNQKINEYYKINNTVFNKVAIINMPKDAMDAIADINSKQLGYLTPTGVNPIPPFKEAPLMALLGSAYRNQYWIATKEYTNLTTYINTLNSISSEMLSSLHVTNDEKTLIYTEIEFLKRFATDLETNPGYWIELYAPSELTLTASLAKEGSILSVGNESLGDKVMGPPHRPGPKKKGCNLDNKRAILMSGVLGGFGNAIRTGIGGAVAGTVVVPGVGTVTGAVSGFMAGFASGFVQGVVLGVITELALTCGR